MDDDTSCEVCGTVFRRDNCRGTGCRYTLLICPRCDSPVVVQRVLHDHESVCPCVKQTTERVPRAAKQAA